MSHCYMQNPSLLFVTLTVLETYIHCRSHRDPIVTFSSQRSVPLFLSRDPILGCTLLLLHVMWMQQRLMLNAT